MNANELIDAYVHDVAVQLPRRQRNDVAFELRELLQEGLQGQADAAGRPADADMARRLLQEFGHPDDVAARYRPAVTIIDPADGQAFLRATWTGLVVIWGLGLVLAFGQPIGSSTEFMRAFSQWWGSAVLPSLWWPGMLVVGFGLAAWTRRRRSAAWRPRSGDRIRGGRGAMVLALAGIAFGVFILIEPRWVLDVMFGGRAAPAAYTALTYSQDFLHGPAPWLLALLVLNIPLFLAVLVKGRWTPTLRQLEIALGLATCAAMAWTALDGPVFLAEASNRMVKFLLPLLVVFSVAITAYQLHQRVTPAPGR